MGVWSKIFWGDDPVVFGSRNPTTRGGGGLKNSTISPSRIQRTTHRSLLLKRTSHIRVFSHFYRVSCITRPQLVSRTAGRSSNARESGQATQDETSTSLPTLKAIHCGNLELSSICCCRENGAGANPLPEVKSGLVGRAPSRTDTMMPLERHWNDDALHCSGF